MIIPGEEGRCYNTARTIRREAALTPKRPSPTYARIYAVVRRIPRGRVATYGQIAALAGLRGHARQVGYALHALPPGTDIPWHRVINARGEVSRRSVPGDEPFQRGLLEAEDVHFDPRGRIRLSRYRWRARTGRRARMRRAGST